MGFDSILHFLFDKNSYKAHWTTRNFEIHLLAYEKAQNDKHNKINGNAVRIKRQTW